MFTVHAFSSVPFSSLTTNCFLGRPFLVGLSVGTWAGQTLFLRLVDTEYGKPPLALMAFVSLSR